MESIPETQYEDPTGIELAGSVASLDDGTVLDDVSICENKSTPTAASSEFPIEEKVNPKTTAELFPHGEIIEIEHIDFDALPKRYIYFFSKRVVDVIIGLFACIVLAIPMIVISVFIKMDSEGPVFHKQERLGKNGKPFILIKFRSMRIDAEANGAQWAQNNDDRITCIGAILRKRRLDEIPQFAQVVTGKLSLIGPRPERPIFYKEFEKHIPGFSQRLKVKPGLSGLAQVRGGYALMPSEKILYDLEYIKTCSFLLDFRIILETLLVVIFHKGAR